MSRGEAVRVGLKSPEMRTIVRRIALFVAVLMSGGMLIIPRLPLLGLLLVLFVMLHSPFELLRRELKGVWILMLAVLVVSLIGAGSIDIGPTATRYANFVGGLALLCLYLDLPRTTFAQDLVPIARLFAIQTLTTVFLTLVVPGVFVPVDVGGTIYHTIFFIFSYHDVIVDPSLIKRPDGFFYEPGVLQIYLNLFLYVSLFIRRNTRDAMLAGAAVIATQSTTGLLIAMLVLGYWYFQRLVTASMREKLIVLFAAPLVFIPLAYIAIDNYVMKTEGVLRGSAWSRQYDLFTGLRVLFESPIFGIGFDVERYYELALRVGYFESQLDIQSLVERGNSNGIVSLAYMVGIPLFLVFMWALVNQRIFPHRLLAAAVVVISLGAESLALTPFFLIIFYSGLLPAPHALMRAEHPRRRFIWASGQTLRRTPNEFRPQGGGSDDVAYASDRRLAVDPVPVSVQRTVRRVRPEFADRRADRD